MVPAQVKRRLTINPSEAKRKTTAVDDEVQLSTWQMVSLVYVPLSIYSPFVHVNINLK
jgi:hypothetical protein